MSSNKNISMNYKKINKQVSVSGQIVIADIPELLEEGIEVLVCNRPDGEAEDQTPFSKIKEAAETAGLDVILMDFASYQIQHDYRDRFLELMTTGKRIHAYCRTGARSTRLWREANSISGVDTYHAYERLHDENINPEATSASKRYEVVIVGAGSAGIATASSLLKRLPNTRIALIDPAQTHYYQPGWTMVGGGIFDVATTGRAMGELIPAGVDWIAEAVVEFSPEQNHVVLANGESLYYEQLVVAPGLTLNWGAVEGLQETLGKNGVTSNYRVDLAPYTWELVQGLKKGKALFTQPPMPIKCAGAPQKALYLSGDHWFKSGLTNQINIEFYNAGAVLFGVADYVPALMEYIERYQAELKYNHNLVKVDGATRTAWFDVTNADGEKKRVETNFDMMHVCPPQTSPDFIKESDLADEAGWLNVDSATLQHKIYANIWGAGDVMNTTNAKTMAAARKQAPVTAQNVCNALQGKESAAEYDGYGSCPLTVERGKIVLAEFLYGGKVSPTFPGWLNDGTKATRLAWHLKKDMLPIIYWQFMLKGREWFAGPV